MRSIALLVDDKEIKRQLKHQLSETYLLMRGRSTAHIPKRSFDLAIVDRSALERLQPQLVERKLGTAPILLPILLIASTEDLGSPSIQSLKTSFDEVLLQPIDARELVIRLQGLFAARERSLLVERSYHALSLTSLAGVVILQGKRVAFANRALADMVGLSLEEFQKLSPQQVRRLVHPDDRRATFRKMLEVYRGHYQQFHTEFRYRRTDGASRWVEMLASRIEYHGSPALQATAIDITDRKRAVKELQKREAVLLQSQKRIQSLYDSMMEGLALHELVYDSEGSVCNYRILDVNPEFEKLLHLTRSEVIGRLATDVYDMEKAPFLDVYAKVARSGGTHQFEAYVEPMGKQFQISVFSPGENQFATTFTDITMRKQMEEALRHSETRYRLLAETTPDLIVMHDTGGKISYVNKACVDLLGYQQAELIGKETSAIIPSDHLEGVAERKQRRLSGEVETLEYEIELIGKNGENVPVDVRSTPIIQEGEVKGILVVARDITERKQSEEALMQSEELYRSLSETTPDIIILQDNVGRIVYINKAGLQFAGYRLDEVINKPVLSFVPESYHQAILEMRQKRMKGDSRPYQFDMELITKSGQRIPLDCRTTPIVKNDIMPHILIVARDITERRIADQALRRSQDLLNKSQAIAQVGSWELDLATNRLIWSDEVYRLFGVTPGEFDATYDSFIASVHPDDQEKVGQTFAQSLEEGGNPYEIEHRIIRRDTGEVRIVLEKCDHIKDKEGKVIRSIGMVQDITERKRAQQALINSERKFREVVAQATDGIMLADREGRIIEWNNRLAEITGMAKGDVIGQPIWQIQDAMAFEEEGSAQIQINREQAVRDLLQSPETKYYGMMFERKIKHINGTVRFVETALYPIRSGNNETMIVSVVRDITERKMAEQERNRLTEHIREQAAEMEQILETVPAGVVLLDAQGVIQQANPVAAEDLMMLAKARVGDRLTRLGNRPLVEILSPPPTGLWHEIGNRNKVYEVIARPMEEGSEDGYWVLVINDVTRDREIRKQLQQQGQLAAVGQLAAGIAHDFNNIIAIIGLYAELGLSAPDLDQKIADRFEMIEQQADRAAQLTQQIMDFSRSSVLQRQPMDLCEFFEEFGQLIQQTLPPAIEIEMFNEADRCSVNADPTRLQQALLNLVLNARDAMRSQGGGTIQLSMARLDLTESVQCITCGQITSGDWLRIQVKDTGSGIEPDVLTHIFEPFFTTKDVGQGTGLGLAQVYGIVKQHDGHINVESTLGEGTTFSIFLPISNLDPVVLESYEGMGRVFGRGEKILVVEDSPVLRSALIETLQLLNYQVVEAENGKEALERLDTYPDIDLVLSDLVMPVMSGQAMFREIQKREYSIPIIMLSGHPMESEMARLKLEGLAGWLLKPPTTDHLAHLVAAVLKGE
jgi:PAS domain S-box-containing protein